MNSSEWINVFLTIKKIFIFTKSSRLWNIVQFNFIWCKLNRNSSKVVFENCRKEEIKSFSVWCEEELLQTKKKKKKKERFEIWCRTKKWNLCKNFNRVPRPELFEPGAQTCHVHFKLVCYSLHFLILKTFIALDEVIRCNSFDDNKSPIQLKHFHISKYCSTKSAPEWFRLTAQLSWFQINNRRK